MEMPELMQRLAEADDRRRAAAPGSTEQREAQLDLERLAEAIEVVSGAELVVSTGMPVFEAKVAAPGVARTSRERDA